MRLLGINISHHPSVAYVENGVIKKFFNEERFILHKNYYPTPTNFIKFVSLQFVKDFDMVCYSSFGRHHKIEELDYDSKIINKIQKQLQFPKYFFLHDEHHKYHATNAFYFSKFDEAAAIVVDGGGATKFKYGYQESQSIYLINKNKIEEIFQNHTKNENNDYNYVEFKKGYRNLFSHEEVGGKVFDTACRKVGYANEGYDAGKLMGLASYAYTKEKFNLNYEHVEIGRKAQEKTFEETCQLIDEASSYSNNIVLSGGYFLNCSNNFKYVKKYPKINFFVDPIPHDAGTASGVCLYYENYH